MNLISSQGRDFWRGRRLAAAAAWLLSRAIRPLGRHFERVFRRRFDKFQARVGQLVCDMPRQQVKWRIRFECAPWYHLRASSERVRPG